MISSLDDFLSYSLKHNNDYSEFSFDLLEHTRVSSSLPGVISFSPLNQHLDSSAAKRVVLSCGIHGNETAPIEICNEMIREIAQGHLRVVHPTLFIFGNLESMVAETRFIDENLNRLFVPKIHEKESHPERFENAEQARAAALMTAVTQFFQGAGDADAYDKATRIHYDLHTAIRASKNEKFAVYPYLHGKPYNKEQLQFMSDCGVNTILLSQTPATTFSYYSSFNHGAHAFTVELGKVKAFGQNDMSKFIKVNKMLRELISKQALSLTPYHTCPLDIYTVNQVVRKHQDDFRLNFTDDTANFTDFKKGELLAEETGAKYVAEHDGEAIVFPNADVALGQRAMLTVIPYEL
ncbi:succinylglutamate desuccinylase [Ningiella sp. W23]|uniref:succinylglutamate desuccinylase n=1 Tax=Ningiella sp. W23 TaxID=3023715 RepID=UPI00375828DF